MQKLLEIKLLVALMFMCFILNSIALENEISCEEFKVDEKRCTDFKKQCLMTGTTKINASGFLIKSPRDEDVERIGFAYNKQIEFLPVNIHESFPNLKNVDAAACAIKKISKANFVNLPLTSIYMDGNLIERLDGDVFEGLTLLTEIYLSYNNIQFIDGQTFSSLHNLKRVDLFNNKCVSKDFRTTDDLENLSTSISKCN